MQKHESIFVLIEEKTQFEKLAQDAATACPAELQHYFTMKNNLSNEAIGLAHEKYVLEIKRYTAYLPSKEPDHYKRAGALLQALCSNPIISKVGLPPGLEDPQSIKDGFSQIPNADAETVGKCLQFYVDYVNQFAAFDIALRACCTHEPTVKNLDFPTVHNICHYLRTNNLVSDSYFMLFRLLMA